MRVKILTIVLAWACAAVGLGAWGLLLTPELMIDLDERGVYVSVACVPQHAGTRVLPLGDAGDKPLASRCTKDNA